jgi:hypothetical protein
MEQKYKNVKDYKINIDYNIDELMNIAKKNPKYKTEIINGFDDFEDFKETTALMAVRTSLENELKVSDTEALNYLTGFPLNFKSKSLVEMLAGYWFDHMKLNEKTDIDKIKYLITHKNKIKETEVGHIAKLKLDFDKKQKLISKNFESTKYIDMQEFLAWAESKGFIGESPFDYGKAL